jgi:Uma2 family endonuclease
LPTPALLPETPKTAGGLSAIVIGDGTRIPAWVTDLVSFRRWARSDQFPDHGRFSYLNGELWVDPDMEQLFSHNQVKAEMVFVLMGIVKRHSLGRFFPDRVFLSHPSTGLSTEPDGVFASWGTLRQKRLRLIRGVEEGFVELEGTPDMILEVVSTKSVRKDTTILRDLYWKTGVSEYWLVDARRNPPQFDVLRHTARSYVAARKQGQWVKSRVFDRSFRLAQETDRLGNPQYNLTVRQ